MYGIRAKATSSVWLTTPVITYPVPAGAIVDERVFTGASAEIELRRLGPMRDTAIHGNGANFVHHADAMPWARWDDSARPPAVAPMSRRRVVDGKIQLLLVDEHPVMRAGVRSLLETDERVEVIGEVDSVAEAVDAARASQPDVVLVDVDGASTETIDDMRRLRAEVPNGAVVVLARGDDDDEVYRAVVGGADGHIGDSAAPDELVETIKEAADGAEPIQRTLAERPAVGRRVLETYAELAQRAPAANERELSDREVRILELAAEGKTNSQIGREIGVSEHTVKGAFSQLLARLRLRHRTEAVVHALRQGWISPPQSEPERVRDDDRD